jgi:putative transposase
MDKIAVKYRMYPTNSQIDIFAKTFGCVRKVYNLMLEDKIKAYKSDKSTIYPTPALYKNDYPYLKEIDSLALSNAQLNLNKAYNNFFKNGKGFPKFQNKHRKKSYTTNNQSGTIEIKDNNIKLPKLKWVKIKNHRQIDGKIKSATISRSLSGKYFVSVLYEIENIKHLPKTNNVVGIDFGIKSFATLSNGIKHKYTKEKLLEKRIRTEQKKLAHKQEKAKADGRICYNKNTKHYDGLQNCKNYQKQKLKIAKLQEKKVNKRNDFQHKLSYKLVKDYDILAIEDLKIKEMLISDNDKKSNIQKKRINEKYHFLGIYDFINKLKYKANWYGKKVITIAKNYPSSQICFSCKKQVDKPLTLTTRVFRCSFCGNKADRDINASKNILAVGTTVLAH